MDNASDYGSEDSRFDSWLARFLFVLCGKYYVWCTEQTFCDRLKIHLGAVIKCLCSLLHAHDCKCLKM